MEMAKGYFRIRWPVMALTAAVFVFFPLVQWLYGMSMEPVRYALLLTGATMAGLLAMDFLRYRERMRALDAVLESLSDAANALPEAVGAVESRYHALAEGLYDRLRAQRTRMEAAHSEQIEYYTLWMHQIKTPLAAMRLSLSGGKADPALMETQLLDVERYVEMALQFVRLEDLQGDMAVSEYALLPMLEEAVKRYAPLFIQKRLRVELPQTDARINTDRKCEGSD